MSDKGNKLIKDKSYVMPFGQFKNESIDDILEEHKSRGASYLKWCHDNVEWFEFDHILLDEIEDMI